MLSQVIHITAASAIKAGQQGDRFVAGHDKGATEEEQRAKADCAERGAVEVQAARVEAGQVTGSSFYLLARAVAVPAAKLRAGEAEKEPEVGEVDDLAVGFYRDKEAEECGQARAVSIDAFFPEARPRRETEPDSDLVPRKN